MRIIPHGISWHQCRNWPVTFPRGALQRALSLTSVNYISGLLRTQRGACDRVLNCDVLAESNTENRSLKRQKLRTHSCANWLQQWGSWSSEYERATLKLRDIFVFWGFTRITFCFKQLYIHTNSGHWRWCNCYQLVERCNAGRSLRQRRRFSGRSTRWRDLLQWAAGLQPRRRRLFMLKAVVDA